MTKRPIFVPNPEGFPYVKEIEVEFNWFPGFSKRQAQRSIDSMHAAARQLGLSHILEISSKSRDVVGISLSAFNLQLNFPGYQSISVECAFQGSKVFKSGGPYTDLYSCSSREAKTDERIRSSGDVIAFRLDEDEFPITPPTAFYDWLYLQALAQNGTLADHLIAYNAFSDIAFNPGKSINCQARSAALYMALFSIGDIDKIIADKDYYLRVVSNQINVGIPDKVQVEQLVLPFKR